MNLTNIQILEIINFAKSIGINPQKLVFNGKGYSSLQKLKYKFTKTVTPTFGNTFYIDIKGTDFRLVVDTINAHMGKEKRRSLIHCIPGAVYAEERKNRYRTFTQILEKVKLWLSAVKDELDAISKINKLMQLPEIVGEEYENENYNQELTKHEKKQLLVGIEKIKKGVSVELNLDDYKLNLINKKLDDLATKLDTLNKFDFKTIFLGLLINLTSSVIYDQAGAFWEIVKSSFPSLIGGKLNNLK